MASRPLHLIAGIVALATATASAPSARGQEAAAPPDAIHQTIAQCLSAGDEIVMVPSPQCTPRQSGDRILELEGMPLRTRDWKEVCGDRDDPRRLPRNFVKDLIRESRIAPSGIRILGAVFCDGIDLVGADLPFSLVLDRSVVIGVLDARNLRLKGDLSFENALIFGTFRLNRAQVGGSIYGGASFMQRLRSFDSQVNGSWQHKDSVIFLDAHIVRLNVSGDLTFAKSAFTRLWVQSSRIDGALDLDGSEARCSYHVNATATGYLTVNDAGFGVVETVRTGAGALDLPWWRRTPSETKEPSARPIFESPAVARILAEERDRLVRVRAAPVPGAGPRRVPGCGNADGLEGIGETEYLEFYVFDSTIQAAFCLTSFEWLAPKGELPDDAHWVSILALDGTRVSGNLIVDLWGPRRSSVADLRAGDPAFARVSQKHKFQAIGLSAGALITEFAGNPKPYFTYIDGLKFERVHKARPACTNESGIKLGSQPELPSVDETMAWLDKNESDSSQPFLTFVQAFEHAGADASALRIKHKTVDLCARSPRWLGAFPFMPCWHTRRIDEPAVEPPATAGPARHVAAALPPASGLFEAAVAVVTGVTLWVATAAALLFQWLLWLVADHGVRPTKVVWSILAVLIVFWEILWRGFGIVAFEPKGAEAKDAAPKSAPAPKADAAHPDGKDTDAAKPLPRSPRLWPISLLFLFDRLIPVYKIRDEHYAIAAVYRLATTAETGATSSGTAPPTYEMRYLGRKYLVRLAGETERQRLDSALVVLRIVGLVLAVFMAAAVNTLVAK